MPRPSKFDRDKALNTVMNEVWRKGYEACSVKFLSEKLSITRSSFYNAFGSREALFKQTLELYFSQSADFALSKARPGVPIRKLFTSTFKNICKARALDRQGRGCMVVNSVAGLCNSDDELGPVLEKAVFSSLARIEQLLEWGVDQDEIDADTDLHATALAVQNLAIGLNVMCKVVRDENELWKTAQTTLMGLNLFEEVEEQHAQI